MAGFDLAGATPQSAPDGVWLFTPEEAAKEVHVGRSVMYQDMKNGRIHVTYRGGNLASNARIRSDHLRNYRLDGKPCDCEQCVERQAAAGLIW